VVRVAHDELAALAMHGTLTARLLEEGYYADSLSMIVMSGNWWAP
jgi:hypothetical protein